MPTITRGFDELYRKLGNAAATETLEPPMRRAVLRGQRFLQEYPPQRTDSRYVRTGTLGKRWVTKITRSSGGLQGKIGNNAKYGPWVQSERFQTRFHRATGWPTDSRFVRENERVILDDFQREVDKALGA